MKLLKTIFNTIFNRMSLMIIMIILELLFFYRLISWFGIRASWIEAIFRLLGLVIVVTIINNSRHLSSDMLWIVTIILVPVVGAALYLFLGADLYLSKTFQSISNWDKKTKEYYKQDPEVLKTMKELEPDISGQFTYLSEFTGYPFYENTDLSYYPVGEEGFPYMVEALKSAQEFIFIEYFIIEEGYMWNTILDILEEKAKQGLEIRVMYDDMGSMMTLSTSYAKKLERKGIKCIPFNKVNPVIGIINNHRNHRKSMIIDGKIAFSGGINLADEYINEIERFGYWKDNIVKISGQAVWSYTLMFLSTWNALSDKKDGDFLKFKKEFPKKEGDGFIAPYADTPLDNETTGQDVYISILNQAKRYCYIFTPYLIIDTELENALILAAKRGVDVRIVTPGIPDKKIIFSITRSYYRNLLREGVKIYEYSPGFLHSKAFLSDDRIATVGSINLDYRSLYLHFENGIYIYGSKEIEKIKKDFQITMKQSKRIFLEDASFAPIKSIFIGFMKLFAPLL